MKLEYRPDIDGLRGISVILVVLFHCNIPYFGSGFYGVDIFFVISGYLITKIILKEINANDFSFSNFYERRLRRIIPALYAILLLLCIYSFTIQAPYFAKDLSQSIFFTSIFFQNFLNIYEAAQYFSLDYDYKSLGHTWSLSIEEQFYLIFPFFLLILFKKNLSKYFFTITIFLIFIFLIAYFYLSLNIPNINFYLTFTRFWEILFGVLICSFNKKNKINSTNISDIGLFLMFSILIMEQIIGHEDIFRVFLVLSIYLIIKYKNEKTISYKILTNKLLVFIGLISYSLYLWHVPIFSIFRSHFDYNLDYYEKFFLILLTLIISILSYKFIEKPFRNKKNFNKKIIFNTSIIGAIIFCIYGYFGHYTNGYESIKIKKIPEDRKKFYVSFNKERKKLEKNKFSISENAETKIFLIGDSVAGDISHALNYNNVYSDRFTLNGPCFKEIVKYKIACKKKLKDIINSARKFDLTIISSDFVNETSELGAIELLKLLQNENINTKIMGSLNFQFMSTVSYQFAKYDYKEDFNKYLFRKLNPKLKKSNDVFEKLIPNDFINKVSLFCNYNEKKCNIYKKNYKPIIFDTKHFTLEGHKILGKKVINELNLRGLIN